MYIEAAAPAYQADCCEMWAVHDFYGDAYCALEEFSPYDRRNGRETSAEEWTLLAHGKIGETKEDDRGSDTRWVSLAELVRNVDDNELDQALADYAEQWLADVQQAVATLREARDTED